MVYLLDNSLYSFENISVIPEIIDKSSVSVNGSWKAFSIRWKPVENVNFGTVFYEVIVSTALNNESRVSKHHMLCELNTYLGFVLGDYY